MYKVQVQSVARGRSREEGGSSCGEGKVGLVASRTGIWTDHRFLRVNLTPDGKQALLKLSKGDMRRALNVLQACHAAYDTVDETAVYNCTGNPHPKDVEAVVQSMMRDEFGTSYECMLQLVAERTSH
jgi:hypothetical protein